MAAPTATDAWTAALDAFERRLLEQESVIAESEAGRQPDHDELVERCSFERPAGLPPLPAALADRVRALQERSLIAQDALVNLLESTRPARSLRPRHGATRSTSAWDLHA